MGLFKKATRAAKGVVKKGAKLGARIVKRAPPYSVGRVVGTLARGKRPRTADLLGVVGVRPAKMKKFLGKRSLTAPVRMSPNLRRMKVASSTSQSPTGGKTASSSMSRGPTPRRKSRRGARIGPPFPTAGEPGRIRAKTKRGKFIGPRHESGSGNLT